MSTEDHSSIQVFVIPPNGVTRPIRVNPFTTINDLRHTAAITSTPADDWDTYERLYWHPRIVRLSADSKPILSESATLQELGIVDGSVIRSSARLEGGGRLKLKIKTKFGCICCNNHCVWDCLCSGRKYTVTVDNIDDVSSIFKAIASQNPKWAEKNASGILIGKNGVLEPDRKILFYGLKDGDQLRLELAPTYWFTSEFRTRPKGVVDEEEEAEFQRAVKEAKEQRKAAAAKAAPTTDNPKSQPDVDDSGR